MTVPVIIVVVMVVVVTTIIFRLIPVMVMGVLFVVLPFSDWRFHRGINFLKPPVI